MKTGFNNSRNQVGALDSVLGPGGPWGVSDAFKRLGFSHLLLGLCWIHPMLFQMSSC